MKIDLIGRWKNKTFNTVGKPYDSKHEAYRLDQQQQYDVPLRPQRTVVQFNSTYMELVDRWEHNRGMAIASQFTILPLGGAIFLFGLYFLITNTAEEGFDFVSLGVSVVCLFVGTLLYIFIKMALREMFTYTYFPIRFNRNNGKVYVINANKQVEVYDWDKLKIHMQDEDEILWDIRCSDVTKDDIVRQTFSLPFKHYNPNEFLIRHFEFVNTYMRSETEEDLKQVADSIRYIHPIHQRKETIRESIERAKFFYHSKWKDMEYPEDSLNKNWFYYASTPFRFFMIVSRIISARTCTIPEYPLDIKERCLIEPDDKFDLNKNPPNPPKPPYTLGEKIRMGIVFMISAIISLSALALMIDMIGAARPMSESPGFFKMLWDMLLLRWI